MAMRSIPLVDGPVEVRGALDLEPTAAGVMPRRLPAWTKEQYQDESVHAATPAASVTGVASRSWPPP